MTSVYVTVNGVPSHPIDVEVPGRYRVNLSDFITHGQIASAALDVLHSNLPVKVLEDFTFCIEDEDGNNLEENQNHDTYSLSKAGSLIGKQDDQA